MTTFLVQTLSHNLEENCQEKRKKVKKKKELNSKIPQPFRETYGHRMRKLISFNCKLGGKFEKDVSQGLETFFLN